MIEDNVYLKPNLVLEPLFAKWYAWSHLISPATAAMNLIGRHLPIMHSYVSAPFLHAQAVKNPKMKGGPFMDFEWDRTAEIKTLEQDTLVSQDTLFRLAQAIKELDSLLLLEATGFGLEELYEKIPDILKGYVELFYDRNNNPGFRFFESLLYNSSFYNKNYQSIALWLTDNDHRPFCLSTPRLTEDQVINLEIPFDNSVIDELSKMKRSPRSFSWIEEKLEIPADQHDLFSTFFTKEAPPAYKRYTGDKIRMRYFGHACILVETKDVSVLVDPLVSYYGYQSEVDHYSDMDLPEIIDYVLITHNHQDHILFETLLPLRHKIRNVIVPRTNSGLLEDPSLKLMFQNIGFHQVIDIEDLEEIIFKDISIRGIPFTGEHSDLHILTKSCYLLKIGAFKLLFFADARICDNELYKHVHLQTGDVDVMFLGMECDGAPLSWLYGPLLTKQIARDKDFSRRLAGSDCTRGMALVNIFRPKEVYVYAMGQEPWLEFISSIKYTDASNPIVQSNALVKQCTEMGLTAERLFGEKELLYNFQPDSQR